MAVRNLSMSPISPCAPTVLSRLLASVGFLASAVSTSVAAFWAASIHLLVSPLARSHPMRHSPAGPARRGLQNGFTRPAPGVVG